jgi:hypothetical protein
MRGFVLLLVEGADEPAAERGAADRMGLLVVIRRDRREGFPVLGVEEDDPARHRQSQERLGVVLPHILILAPIRGDLGLGLSLGLRLRLRLGGWLLGVDAGQSPDDLVPVITAVEEGFPGGLAGFHGQGGQVIGHPPERPGNSF